MKQFKYISFGITNKTKDNFYLPFFDYDINDLPNICLELKDIQKRFQLSTIYIIKSTNGYNAFSFDKLPFDYLKTIYLESKLIDKDFIKWGLNRGFMTLRMGSDKKYRFSLSSENVVFEKSLAHKKFFNNIMGFGILTSRRSFFDKNLNIIITMFPSNKHGFKKELIDY